MHVEEHDQEADDDAEGNHGARKRLQLRKIRGTHERDVFSDGAHAVERSEIDDLRASAFSVAFAADVEHGDTFFRAGDFLGGFQRNEVTSAFAVSDDAANGKGMIQENDPLTDL